MLRSRPGTATAKGREATGLSAAVSLLHPALGDFSGSPALVRTYRLRHKRPTGRFSFGRLFRQLAPLEGRQLHHIADGESARQTSQSIALRCFAEAFLTTIHEQPQRTSEFTQQK